MGCCLRWKLKGETIKKKLWPRMPTNQQVSVCIRRHHAMAYMIKRIMTNLSEGSKEKQASQVKLWAAAVVQHDMWSAIGTMLDLGPCCMWHHTRHGPMLHVAPCLTWALRLVWAHAACGTRHPWPPGCRARIRVSEVCQAVHHQAV